MPHCKIFSSRRNIGDKPFNLFKRLNVQSEKLEHDAAETNNFTKCFKQKHPSLPAVKQQHQNNSGNFSNKPYHSSKQYIKLHTNKVKIYNAVDFT